MHEIGLVGGNSHTLRKHIQYVDTGVSNCVHPHKERSRNEQPAPDNSQLNQAVRTYAVYQGFHLKHVILCEIQQ